MPDPVLGTIYNPDLTYLPTFTQPGGAFTPVFPQQDPGEMLGLWVGPCGHWFNHWDVIRASVAGQPSSIMRCPLCGCVARIYTPADLIYTFENEFLIA